MRKQVKVFREKLSPKLREYFFSENRRYWKGYRYYALIKKHGLMPIFIMFAIIIITLILIYIF